MYSSEARSGRAPGSIVHSFAVVRDLHSVRLHEPMAVERAVEVEPARHPGCCPVRRHVEEADVLAGDAQVDHPREQPAEPGAAGPDHVIGLEPATVRQRGARTGRRGGSAHDLEPTLAGPGDERAHAVARAQHAALGFEQGESDVVDGEAREEPRRLLRRQALDRHAGGPQRRLAVRLPAVLAMRQPDRARLDQDPGAQLTPDLQRLIRKICVEAVGAVREAEHARLAAGLRARVARLEDVDERDLPAVRHEPVGKCRPEDPASDDERGGHRPTG